MPALTLLNDSINLAWFSLITFIACFRSVSERLPLSATFNVPNHILAERCLFPFSFAICKWGGSFIASNAKIKKSKTYKSQFLAFKNGYSNLTLIGMIN